MLLADIGNSCLKWTWLHDGVLQPGERALYREEGLASVLARHWAPLRRPQRLLVANVGGAEAAAVLSEWTRQRWDLVPEFLCAQASAFGVRNAYAEPHRLGSDRWAALIATHHSTPRAACIVDCGTAITIDALAADGQHLGGLIVPGLATMRRALLDNTSGIELRGEAMEAVSLLARDTEGAVRGGTLYAAVAVIDRVVADVRAALGKDVARIITGGDAPILLALLGERFVHEPDLVLQGLAVVASQA